MVWTTTASTHARAHANAALCVQLTLDGASERAVLEGVQDDSEYQISLSALYGDGAQSDAVAIRYSTGQSPPPPRWGETADVCTTTTAWCVGVLVCCVCSVGWRPVGGARVRGDSG